MSGLSLESKKPSALSAALGASPSGSDFSCTGVASPFGGVGGGGGVSPPREPSVVDDPDEAPLYVYVGESGSLPCPPPPSPSVSP